MQVAAKQYRWAFALTLMGAGTILAQNAPPGKEPPPLRPVSPKPVEAPPVKPKPVKVAAAPAPTPVFINEPIEMAIGEIRMVTVPGKIKRIALGSGAQASVTTVDNQLMIIGETTGHSSVVVWAGDQVLNYKLRIIPTDYNTSRRLLDRILANSKRLHLEEIESRMIVSGAATRAEIDQLTALTKIIDGLRLNVQEDQENKRSVLFRLHFVEVNKSLLESLGIQWAKEANGPAFATQNVMSNDGIYRNIRPPKQDENLLAPVPPFVSVGGRTSGVFFGLVTTIASRIKLGQSDGDVRILASPELTAVSGGKAKLQVGGEIPIPLAGPFGTQTVEFKPYGILFNIEPKIGPNDTITAMVSTELSQIDPAVSVAGIPGFLTRNTSTEINVRPGEMVALSGLVNSELSTAIDKVPGLGSIPILGRLFRSDDFRNKRTDLVVLLEPEIITSGQGMAESLKERGKDSVKAFEAKIQEQAAPPKIQLAPQQFQREE
jgi:pilus assembly protein CpaC